MERIPDYPPDYLTEIFGEYLDPLRRELIHILMGDVNHQRELAIQYAEGQFGALLNIADELTKQLGTPKIFETFAEWEHVLPLLKMDSEFIAYRAIWYCAFDVVSARIGRIDTKEPTPEKDRELLLELLESQEYNTE